MLKLQVAVTYTNGETVFSLEFSRDDRNIPPNSSRINGRISEAEWMLLSVLQKSPSMTNVDLAAASERSERTILPAACGAENQEADTADWFKQNRL